MSVGEVGRTAGMWVVHWGGGGRAVTVAVSRCCVPFESERACSVLFESESDPGRPELCQRMAHQRRGRRARRSALAKPSLAPRILSTRDLAHPAPRILGTWEDLRHCERGT
eukprot:2229691-Rhodomonas_salina.1